MSSSDPDQDTPPERESLFEHAQRTDPIGMAGALAAVQALALLNWGAEPAPRDRDELAATLGVTRQRVDDILDGDGNVRVSTLARVLRASGYRLALRAVPLERKP